MSLVPNKTQQSCFIACDKEKIESGQCSCVNTFSVEFKLPCLTFIGFINDPHSKCEECGKEEWEHKLYRL